MKFSERIQLGENLVLKAKDTNYNSKKNPRVHHEQGVDYNRDRKKYVHLERRVSRDQDLYREVITDPDTGEVIHKCEEPLSKHQGHGDAKRSR